MYHAAANKSKSLTAQHSATNASDDAKRSVRTRIKAARLRAKRSTCVARKGRKGTSVCAALPICGARVLHERPLCFAIAMVAHTCLLCYCAALLVCLRGVSGSGSVSLSSPKASLRATLRTSSLRTSLDYSLALANDSGNLLSNYLPNELDVYADANSLIQDILGDAVKFRGTFSSLRLASLLRSKTPNTSGICATLYLTVSLSLKNS